MTFSRFNSLVIWTKFALITVLIWSAEVPFAHHSNKHAVRHDLLLTVGTRNIDLELELTFFAASSAKERTRMDSDNDGTIIGQEAAAYVDQVVSVLRDRIRILVDDQPLDTLLLYHPEIDLLGEETNQPYSHLLRLFFFARTPIRIKKGSVITVEDNLWPELLGIHSMKAEGIEGFKVVATKAENSVSRDDKPYLSSALCLSIGRNLSDSGAE